MTTTTRTTGKRTMSSFLLLESAAPVVVVTDRTTTTTTHYRRKRSRRREKEEEEGEFLHEHVPNHQCHCQYRSSPLSHKSKQRQPWKVLLLVLAAAVACSCLAVSSSSGGVGVGGVSAFQPNHHHHHPSLQQRSYRNRQMLTVASSKEWTTTTSTWMVANTAKRKQRCSSLQSRIGSSTQSRRRTTTTTTTTTALFESADGYAAAAASAASSEPTTSSSSSDFEYVSTQDISSSSTSSNGSFNNNNNNNCLGVSQSNSNMDTNGYDLNSNNGFTIINNNGFTIKNNNNDNNNKNGENKIEDELRKQRLNIGDDDEDDDVEDDDDEEDYDIEFEYSKDRNIVNGNNNNNNKNGNNNVNFQQPSNGQVFKNGAVFNNPLNGKINNYNKKNGDAATTATNTVTINGGDDAPCSAAAAASAPVNGQKLVNGQKPANGQKYPPTNNGKKADSSSSSSCAAISTTAPEVNRWILSKDMFAQAATQRNNRNGQQEGNDTLNNNKNNIKQNGAKQPSNNSNSNNNNSNPSSMNNNNNNNNVMTINNNRLHLLKHYPELKDLSDYDRQQIDMYWDELLPLVSYLGTQIVAKIYNALMVAYRAHVRQVRKSGEPFIIHPVEVAKLLAGLRMDGDTIIAGLLHDTVEDTELTFDQIDAMFGRVVRSIVEGETKVSKLPKLAFTDYADEQAENLRQMFVAMTDDYRIIIVKLADRLHNMRTLRHMKPEKQVKISRETLDIFAPLAHRMGIWQFKSELEDTAFMYLYPQEYKRLNKRLRQHQKKFRETLDKSQEILKRTLDRDPTLQEQAAEVRVYGRTKEIYSLWHKMETKGEENLDHIVDVVALRVILTPKGEGITTTTKLNHHHHRQSSSSSSLSSSSSSSSSQPPPPILHTEPGQPQTDRGVWLCYHVLGLVQHLPGFQPVPTRVKDYISFPKPNGYQSLHTALMLNGQTIEVQIRTNLMHQVAEYGMASHWAYTDGKRQQQQQGGNGSSSSSNNNNSNNNDNEDDDDDCFHSHHSHMEEEELYNTPWLSSIKEWQDDIISSRDFVDSVRRELLGKRVFVFLRNGKILNLARGATAIDAAFAIHTEVGLAMHGVEINGKPVPFSYELRNGDVVSILTGEGKPAVDWMRFAKSRSTRSKLRSYFRKMQKESLREAGRILLTDYLWMHGPLIEKTSFLPGEWSIPTTVEELSAFSKGRTHYEDIDDLLIDIGKRHDRMFLHGVVAKLFQVPETLLFDAEKNKKSLVPTSVFVAVQESRQQAKDAAAAAAATVDSDDCMDANAIPSVGTSQSLRTPLLLPLPPPTPPLPVTVNNFPKPRNATTHLEKLLHGLEGTPVEFADHEQMCEDCLPVLGDEILGTRPVHSVDAATTVHRIGCPHAQRAINQLYASKGIPTDLLGRVNSVSLRNSKTSTNRYYGKRSVLTSAAPPRNDVPVRLRWSDMPGEEQISFMTEVKIVAEDRKLLLADCSGVVSQLSEIVRTGSATTQEHAVLVFLVRVSGLDHLQHLMDNLSQIRSVMSVERVFGSELL